MVQTTQGAAESRGVTRCHQSFQERIFVLRTYPWLSPARLQEGCPNISNPLINPVHGFSDLSHVLSLFLGTVWDNSSDFLENKWNGAVGEYV